MEGGASSSYVATAASNLILIYCEPRERATTTDSYDRLYPQLSNLPHRAIKCVDSEYLKNKSWEHKTFLLVLPGGIFSKCEYYLEVKGILKIINFVKNHRGRIFGICSWAYGLSQKSSYVTIEERIERDRTDSPLYLCPTIAEGPIKSPSPPSTPAFDWESASFESSPSTFSSELVQIYSCDRRSRTLSSPFTFADSFDSFDVFQRFQSPPPLCTQTSPSARTIKIWRPDGTSGSCHYLNGAKLTLMQEDPAIVNFASFDPEGSELAIVGYTPLEGDDPGDALLSSVHLEYVEPGPFSALDSMPMQALFEELSSPKTLEFNKTIWEDLLTYFDPSGDYSAKP